MEVQNDLLGGTVITEQTDGVSIKKLDFHVFVVEGCESAEECCL